MTDKPAKLDLSKCAKHMKKAVAALPEGMNRIDMIAMLQTVGLTEMGADMQEGAVAFASIQTRQGKPTFVHMIDPQTGTVQAFYDARMVSPDVVKECLGHDGLHVVEALSEATH